MTSQEKLEFAQKLVAKAVEQYAKKCPDGGEQLRFALEGAASASRREEERLKREQRVKMKNGFRK